MFFLFVCVLFSSCISKLSDQSLYGYRAFGYIAKRNECVSSLSEQKSRQGDEAELRATSNDGDGRT